MMLQTDGSAGAKAVCMAGQNSGPAEVSLEGTVIDSSMQCRLRRQARTKHPCQNCRQTWQQQHTQWPLSCPCKSWRPAPQSCHAPQAAGLPQPAPCCAASTIPLTGPNLPSPPVLRCAHDLPSSSKLEGCCGEESNIYSSSKSAFTRQPGSTKQLLLSRFSLIHFWVDKLGTKAGPST